MKLEPSCGNCTGNMQTEEMETKGLVRCKQNTWDIIFEGQSALAKTFGRICRIYAQREELTPYAKALAVFRKSSAYTPGPPLETVFSAGYCAGIAAEADSS